MFGTLKRVYEDIESLNNLRIWGLTLEAEATYWDSEGMSQPVERFESLTY